jgi:hypothetical protein
MDEGFRICVRKQSFRKGTASAVPQQDDMDEGFSPCLSFPIANFPQSVKPWINATTVAVP